MTHMGSRYKCDQCSFIAISAQNLEQHMAKSHSGEAKDSRMARHRAPIQFAHYTGMMTPRGQSIRNQEESSSDEESEDDSSDEDEEEDASPQRARQSEIARQYASYHTPSGHEYSQRGSSGMSASSTGGSIYHPQSMFSVNINELYRHGTSTL